VVLVLGRHGLIDGVWFEVGWAGVDLFFVLQRIPDFGPAVHRIQKNSTHQLAPVFHPARLQDISGILGNAHWVVFYRLCLRVAVPGFLWWREILFISELQTRHLEAYVVARGGGAFLYYPSSPAVALNRLSKNRKDPFWFIPYAFCILAPVTLAMRYVAVYQPSYRPEEFWKHMFLTTCALTHCFSE